MTPTILIPGSSATQERFNSMLAQLNQMGEKHSVLKLTVKKTIALSTMDKLAAMTTNPTLSLDLKIMKMVIVTSKNKQNGYRLL